MTTPIRALIPVVFVMDWWKPMLGFALGVLCGAIWEIL